ncbi:MAG: helix-turn-helix domain-containing protein [Pseudomonadota bacterium]
MAENYPIQTGAYIVGVDQVADVWTVLILREAFAGARRFADFAARLPISRARLTERLKHLLTGGLLERRPYGLSAQRMAYWLTPKGAATYPILLTLRAWAEQWRPATGAPLISGEHGAPLLMRTICRSCGETVRREDVRWPPLIPLRPGQRLGGDTNEGVRRWRKMASFDAVSRRPDAALTTLAAFGDRWSMLIMYGAQLGPFQFSQAQQALGLAPNILSDRLKHLIDGGLIRRSADHTAAYEGAPAGLALFECILAIRSWAIDWETPEGDWAPVTHGPCGADLLTDQVCVGCGAAARLGAAQTPTSETAVP